MYPYFKEDWFTKEGIDTYLQEKQKEYSFAFKAKNPYDLKIVFHNNDPRSASYVKTKTKVANLYNINAFVDDISATVLDNQKCPQMIQYPHCDFKKFVDKSKVYDVEGLSKFWRNMQFDDPGNALWPCTARGIYDHAVWVANKEEKSLEGKIALIIGRSDLVGRPIAQMFERLQNMTVIQCHSHTPYKEITSLIWHADIVVCAVGKPNFLSRSCFGYHQYVYDVGINPISSSIVGDISSKDTKEDLLKSITPVPGGVGKLTVHALMHNTLDWYLNKEYYFNYDKS